MQYLNTRADFARIEGHLTSDSDGTPLPAGVRARLHRSVTCLVIVDLFTQRTSSPTLRAALAATPRPPGADALRTLAARSRREIDAAPGSAIRKALLVDHFRYVFDQATRGRDVQPIVDRANQVLADGCPPP
jgi:hypothetical protein